MKIRTKTRINFLWIAFILGAAGTSCTHKAAFPGTPWTGYPSPEAAGFDAAKLDDLTRYIRDSSRTTGLLVVYDGRTLYEYGNLTKVTYIASCRKSVLSMLYGKHVADGTIDLNATIGSMGIDEKDGLLPIEKKATVDHIITSRSGVFHLASNGGYDKDNFLERGSAEPGTYFVYNNWDFNVGGHLLEQFVGRSIYEEMETQLAKPLGFQDWNLKNQKKSGNKRKSQYPAYHMYLSTRDMARIGQLMLNEGAWEGTQLIPKDWIQKTTTTVTPMETMIERYGPPVANYPQMSYGYMWWLIDSFRGNPAYQGGFTASGYGGQYITVLPARKLVIAHKTKLNIPTLLGIAYKATEGDIYFKIVDKLVNAQNRD